LLQRSLWLETRRHPRLILLLGSLELFLALGVAWAGAGWQSPVGYAPRRAAGVELHVITVDLNDPRVVVSPSVAIGGVGKAESFSHAVKRLRPKAAVNGTFFSKRTLRPIGDIVIGGKLAYFGGMGTALAFAADGVDFIRLPKSRRVDWTGYQAALAAGPLLVWDGFAKPAPGGEGFGDPHVFARAAPRTAVGVTKENRLLLVTTVRGSSLGKLAQAMRDLGAVYAVNLDGGSSTAMWYDGRMIRSARRELTNFLCVYVKPTPARAKPARPPRGLDWRAGHQKEPPAPVIGFRAAGARVWAELPRQWGPEQTIEIRSDSPLPEQYTVSVQLDRRSICVLGALPAEVKVRIEGAPRPKHKLWIGLLDADGKAVGSAYRIFHVAGSPSP